MVVTEIHFLISGVNKVNGDVLKFNQVLKQVNDEVHLFNHDVINVIAYEILVASYENVVRGVDILGNNDIFNCSIYFDHFLIETLNPLGKVIKIPVDKRDRSVNPVRAFTLPMIIGLIERGILAGGSMLPAGGKKYYADTASI
jgi:hypothetical protein